MAKQGFRVIEPPNLWDDVVAELGDDNLVLSTDWPHDDSRFPHALDAFLGMADVSTATKQKVLWDNCARLYKM